MTETQISKVKALTARMELLEKLHEGFLDGSAFSPGVKQAMSASLFSALSSNGAMLVSGNIKDIKSELEAL